MAHVDETASPNNPIEWRADALWLSRFFSHIAQCKSDKEAHAVLRKAFDKHECAPLRTTQNSDCIDEAALDLYHTPRERLSSGTPDCVSDFPEPRALYYSLESGGPPALDEAFRAATDRAREELRRSIPGASNAPAAEVEYVEMTIAQRMRQILSTLKPGQDLTHMEMPPHFLSPYSSLQAVGEPLGVLEGSSCSWAQFESSDPIERFVSVLSLHLSLVALRSNDKLPEAARGVFLLNPGQKPCNSVLGETHRLRCGHTTIFGEQLSHHPPSFATMTHKTDAGIKILANATPTPRFIGTGVHIDLMSRCEMQLEHSGDTISYKEPDLFIRLMGIYGPYVEVAGDVDFCMTNPASQVVLRAHLRYEPRGAAGRKKNMNRVSGEVWKHSGGTRELVYRLSGRYDRSVTFEGKGGFTWTVPTRSAFTPEAEVPCEYFETDSVAVWSELTHSIALQDWRAATAAKKKIEQAQRKLMGELKSKQIEWRPQLFHKDDHGTWRPNANPAGVDELRSIWRESMSKSIYCV